MFGTFYNSSFRRYIVLMGDLFSHIHVIRKRDGNKTEFIKVPITYASKERFMMKLNSPLSINSEENIAKVETILPRMSLNMVDIMYNSQYKTNILNRKISTQFTGHQISQYNPTPVKMIFELGIYTRHQDDMFQIVEQILPYFQPHFNTTMTELFDHDIKFERDIRVVLQSISPDETVETDNMTRRRLEWTIIFEVNGWIYPPVAEINGEIRTIYLDFFANTKELDMHSNFESIDTQVKPVDVEADKWDGSYIQTHSDNIPIPVDPQPPHPRGR